MERKEEEKTRIYVGGLGEKVTNDDLIKIFSSLGRVTAVDIVRTKDRSFGYVDFSPSSDKSIPKLFSTYNGCVWKGARLRLEKAKEHYLARLKREWEEDSELASSTAKDSVDADKDMASLEKPKKVLDLDKKLKIFFPRFSKLKALPFSGTGKHKYSFQRVEAPPVPMHFCDCEEHSVPFCTADGKRNHHHTAEEERILDLEAQGGVINEEELNIMNSVMNKLFERENVSNVAQSGRGMANDGHYSDKLIEDQKIGETELDGVADEDNLVINVVSRGNNRMAFQGKATISSKNKNFKSFSALDPQKLSFGETQTSKDRPAQSVPKEQKKNNLPPNKKRKPLHNDDSVGNEFVVANPGGDINLQTNTNQSRIRLGTQHTETESAVKQSAGSHPWSQKLSWKELVGNKDSRVFSVSNILPADPSTKETDNDIESFEELEFDENELDEDNLVINVVSKKNKKRALSRSQEQEKEKISTMNQKSIFNESKASKDRPIQQKKSTPPPKKKRKSVADEESDRNKSVHKFPQSDGSVQTRADEMGMLTGAQPTEQESSVKQLITDHSRSQKSSLRGLVGDKGNDELSVSNVVPDNSAKEEQPVADGPDVPGSTDSKNQNTARSENLEGKSAKTETAELLVEAQPTKTDAAPDKSGRGSSWFQKSSWTQLVNDNNSSFSITQISPAIAFKKSITQISPAIAFKKPEVSKPLMGMDIVNPTDKFSNLVRQDKSEPNRGGSTAMVDGKEGDATQNIPEKSQLTVVGNNEGSTSTVENKCDSVQRQTIDGDVTIGETCLFMRNATSMKEWAKAKAALSGSQSHKRKRNEK